MAPRSIGKHAVAALRQVKSKNAALPVTRTSIISIKATPLVFGQMQAIYLVTGGYSEGQEDSTWGREAG